MTDPSVHSETIARAYDSLADYYDAALEADGWVRARLWERLDRLFPPGSLVLDVTAGTGLDAVHLAGRGVRVVACDLSPGMLARLRAKDSAIETHLMDFNRLDLALLARTGRQAFDGLISTFAGLNTSEDLAPFARSAARLLKPGGWLAVHMLNRWPALDVLRRLAGGRPRQAWQTLASTRRSVNLAGIPVEHAAYSPDTLYRRVFAADFALGRIEAHGVLRPVSAGWGAGLDRWERALAHQPPWRALGTFFLMEMIRR